MAMNVCATRIQREIKEIINSRDLSESGILIEVIDSNLQNLRGYIKGPSGSPYDGGTFTLDIKVPDCYPFKPPVVKFVTRVWHPNVSSVTGTICLDVLKDNW
jgi:ubiquitin-conjugating enzyme (huntingtin interacting protein 2)